MRNPEEIKAKYPASNNTLVHQQWMKEMPDSGLIDLANIAGIRYPHGSKSSRVFCDKKNGNGWTLIMTRYYRKVSPTNQMMRWAQSVFIHFTPTPNGLRVMARYGKRQAWGFVAIDNMLASLGCSEKWFSFLIENFSAEDFIPQAKYLMSISDYSHGDLAECLKMSPYILDLISRHSGVKGVMNEIFKGTKNGVPKDIFGGVMQERIDLKTLSGSVHMARALSGYGEIGLSFLRKVNYSDIDRTDSECSMSINKNIKRYGEFFRHSQHSFNKIAHYLVGSPNCCTLNSFIRDITEMLFRLDRKNRKMVREWYRGSRDMRDLHDHLSAVIQKMEHEDRPINVKKLSQFQGDVGNDIVCVAPKSTHDLVDWGCEANICIGSYADLVREGRTYCFAFARDGVNIGYAEVSKEMRLRQLLGKYNKPLDPAIKEPIVAYLEKKGVDSSNYWGMRDAPL